MIINMAGGAKRIGITVNGAVGETITYTGPVSGSVVLSSTGAGSVPDLLAGTYTFTGSVSGYSKTVTLKDSGVVNVWPGKALYWYGNGDTAGETLFPTSGGIKLRYWNSEDSADPPLVQEETSFSFNTYSSGGGGNPKMAFPANKTDLSGYTRAHAVIRTANAGTHEIHNVFAAFADANSLALTSAGQTAAEVNWGATIPAPTEVAFDISGLSGAYDLCVCSGSSRSQQTTTVYAIWVD